MLYLPNTRNGNDPVPGLSPSVWGGKGGTRKQGSQTSEDVQWILWWKWKGMRQETDSSLHSVGRSVRPASRCPFLLSRPRPEVRRPVA